VVKAHLEEKRTLNPGKKTQKSMSGGEHDEKADGEKRVRTVGHTKKKNAPAGGT